MKSILLATTMLAGGMMMAGTSQAQDKVLYVGAYGGSTETLMKETIIPQFEAAHNVRIEYVAGNSTENLARLQAQAGNQELDVVILDDGPMYQAMQLGFCGEVNAIPNLASTYKLAQMGSNLIGLGIVASVIGYNSEIFAEKGLEPPTSWNDLADTQYAGLLSVPPISNTYGLHALVMLARLHGGGETNIDPGFAFVAERVAPNVLVFEASRIAELYQSKEVAISVWGTGRFASLQDTGLPIEVVYPEEGAVALMITGCPVAGSEESDLAQAFLNYLLEPEIQVQLAETQGWGPVNTEAVLPEEVAARVPYGAEQVDKLVPVDWDTINTHRQEWTQRWAREIER